MIDEHEEALLDSLAEKTDEQVRWAAASLWSTCKTGSLALALLARLAPREILATAAIACARHALPARSSPEPELAAALDDALAGQEAARRASRVAYQLVSRHVAGVDDDVALAVADACDLAAGDAFEYGGPDPAARASWAWAWRRCGDAAAREDVERMDAVVQAELADLVRAIVGARWTPPALST